MPPATPKDAATMEYMPDVGSTVVQKVYGPSSGIAVPVKDASQMIHAKQQPEFATLSANFSEVSS